MPSTARRCSHLLQQSSARHQRLAKGAAVLRLRFWHRGQRAATGSLTTVWMGARFEIESPWPALRFRAGDVTGARP
jgi:hypothetical protein